MSKRDHTVLLTDILESIEKIKIYIEKMDFEEFSEDPKTVDAVVRNLEIIGEAANKIPDPFKESHADIEWYKIIGLRNRIIHEYFGVDNEIIWQIIKNDLKKLRNQFQSISS